MTTGLLRRDIPSEYPAEQSTGFWAMLLFIATEATLFASLIAAYFYIESGFRIWPPDGIAKPELTLSSINTGILILSSLPIWWADQSIREGNQRGLRIGLATTFVLGLIFLSIQGYEYTVLPFSFSKNAYSSLFFTITGIHFLHVSIGLLMILYIQVRAWLGHFSVTRRLAVLNVEMYWHFVDVAWIVIYLSLIVQPHLH